MHEENNSNCNIPSSKSDRILIHWARNYGQRTTCCIAQLSFHLHTSVARR